MCILVRTLVTVKLHISLVYHEHRHWSIHLCPGETRKGNTVVFMMFNEKDQVLSHIVYVNIKKMRSHPDVGDTQLYSLKYVFLSDLQ